MMKFIQINSYILLYIDLFQTYKNTIIFKRWYILEVIIQTDYRSIIV